MRSAPEIQGPNKIDIFPKLREPRSDRRGMHVRMQYGQGYRGVCKGEKCVSRGRVKLPFLRPCTSDIDLNAEGSEVKQNSSPAI